MTHYRHPVAISVAVTESDLEIVYVVCDDGTAWELDVPGGIWLPLLPIPGSWADESPEADDPDDPDDPRR